MLKKRIAVKPPGPIHQFFFRTKTINALFTKLSTNDLSFLSILLIKIMCGVVYPGGSLFHVSGYWIYIVLYLEWHHLILQVLQLFPFLLEFFAYYISPPSLVSPLPSILQNIHTFLWQSLIRRKSSRRITIPRCSGVLCFFRGCFLCTVNFKEICFLNFLKVTVTALKLCIML